MAISDEFRRLKISFRKIGRSVNGIKSQQRELRSALQKMEPRITRLEFITNILLVAVSAFFFVMIIGYFL